MNTRSILSPFITAVLVVAASLVVVTHYHHKPTPPQPKPVAAVCHIQGALPDPTCTPGATYAGVTQSNIQQTICVRGWTATIRPPQSYTTPLKIQSIKDYGYKDTNLAHYEEDHLIPLELGGNPVDVKNLWAEPGATPNKKDAIEGELRVKVCNGSMTLLDAQQRIASNWQTALQ